MIYCRSCDASSKELLNDHYFIVKIFDVFICETCLKQAFFACEEARARYRERVHNYQWKDQAP